MFAYEKTEEIKRQSRMDDMLLSIKTPVFLISFPCINCSPALSTIPFPPD
jgi:hypothetical protein